MSIKILVAGGCHVVGYPIGATHSFATLMADRLFLSGIDTRVEKLAYLPAGHVARMVAAIRSMRPDVIVLQLGNYETTVTFRQYARQKLGMQKMKASSAQSHLRPSTIFDQKWSWKAKCSLKLIADSLLRQDLIDFKELDSKYSVMFDAIRAETDGEVIVLAPLPCADPLYLRYRERLAVMMQRLAFTRGFLFIPSPLGEDRHERYFADATHLNAAGQECLGNTLAAVIGNLCRSLPQQLVVR